jgi:catechol 2,3-dioxygenase-like lactoylglutathione lyase family enzyme
VLERVFYTSVLVSDQDEALDFYTNVLGLEKRAENPTPDGPRFLTVGVKGDDFQLVLWPGTPGQAEPAMGRPPASITIETDDVRKTFEELKARGVEFVSDVLEFPWGSRFDRAARPPERKRLSVPVAPGAGPGLLPWTTKGLHMQVFCLALLDSKQRPGLRWPEIRL